MRNASTRKGRGVDCQLGSDSRVLTRNRPSLQRQLGPTPRLIGRLTLRWHDGGNDARAGKAGWPA